MSRTTFTFNLVSTTYNLQVTLNVEALNIHIENSYQITKAKDIEEVIDTIMKKFCYRSFAAAGFTRTRESLIREWKAHNVLHRWGFEKDRTRSVDLNQHETRGRRVLYAILSIFF